MTEIAAGPGFALPRGVEPGRAVIVGAGPNGLTAAALLAREGWEVDVFERAPVPGGACASAPVLGEGTVVDLGAAGHPFGVASPVFRELGLTDHGLAWLHPAVPMGHPLPDGPAALLHRDLEATAVGLGVDARAWRAVHGALVEHVDEILAGALGPVLRPPPHPVAMARFGLRAPWPADLLGRAMFRTEAARALFTGSAAHAILPSSRPLTAAFGALFGALGMSSGWPVARGGSGAIVDALVAVLRAHGGRLHLGQEVTDLALQQVRTLAFIRSRRGAEAIASAAKRQLEEVEPGLGTRIAAYRSGYLPEERRELEADLRSGRLLGMASTPALEMGIDVAGLDAVVVAGWPGTRASFFQQIGRAGRGGQDALAFFVASDDPLDTFVVDHPEAVFDLGVEDTVVDPENPHLLGPQLCAAAAELPITPTWPSSFT